MWYNTQKHNFNKEFSLTVWNTPFVKQWYAIVLFSFIIMEIYNKINNSVYNTTSEVDQNYINKSWVTIWLERWFCSSNAKDIGTLYLIFAIIAGLMGTAFSVLIRLELSAPGVQFIADNQLYNSIITAHAIIMIFFMVKKNFLY